jgi:hypothetical protein
MSNVRYICIMLLCSALTSTIISIGISHWGKGTAYKMAGVDIEYITSNIVIELAKSSVDKEALAHAASQKLKQLDFSLKEIAEKQHLILIPSKAIIAGAPNITDQIMSLMKLSPQAQPGGE